jgi:hypothetical protein
MSDLMDWMVSMKTVVTLFVLLTASWLMTSDTLAQLGDQPTGVPTPERVLKRFNKDREDTITRDKFSGPPMRFKTMGRDGDGHLTATELNTAFQRPSNGGDGPRGCGGPQGPLLDWHQNLPIILTHAHFIPFVGRANTIKVMNQNMIRAAPVMSTPVPAD